MATSGGGKKAGKKKKGQTISLNAFLGDGPDTFTPPPKKNWADEDADMGPADLAEEYGGPPEPPIDLSKLPSAPRSSRGADIDMSRLPRQPPYTAFLGNLPFDVSEDDIKDLFRGLRVENIRFPQDQGRMKGFGYAEFFDLEQFKSALALSNEKIQNRQIRVDIADQAGKDGRGGGFDDNTPGDWRRDDMSGGGGSRYGDRGGPGERRDGGFSRPGPGPGPADTEDCWRRNDAPPQHTNGSDDKSGRGQDDAWGGRGGGGFRDSRSGFRDDRGGGFRDDRGGGFRDDRGGGFRDDRGGGFRDDRGGGFRNDRGGFRDDRGSGRDDRGGFRDDRGGFRDDRGGFRDDRGGFRDGSRDSRGGGDFRDNRGGGYRDDRGGGFRDSRGAQQDRGDYRDGGSGFKDERSRDAPVDRPDGPRERPKLNLQKRTAEQSGATSAATTSSIFGEARPVDTAAKERQIEEKLMQESEKPKGRGRGESRERENRDGSRERGQYGSPPGRDSYRPPPRDEYGESNLEEGDTDNWRDESLRTADKTRVMRPGFVKDVGKKDDDQHRGRDSGNRGPAGRGRSPQDKRPTVLPKYEEPAKPDFVQTSKFAALGLEDDDDEVGSNPDAQESQET